MVVKQIKSRFLRGEFDQNTYVCIEDKDVVIIDAGAELDDIKKIVRGKNVLGVLMTHLHFDHLYNIEKYVEEFDCDVYICSGAESSLLSPRENASVIIYEDLKFNIPNKNIKYYPDSLSLGKFEFKVIKTSGHTKDSVCLLIQNLLFTGDTVFSNNIGRTDLVGGDISDMEESLRKLLSIDYDVAYPGHFEKCKKSEIDRVIKNYISILN